MTKTLRWKMALIAMASLVSILAIIVLTVNVISFANVKEDADRILDVLLENGGQFIDSPAQNPEAKPPAASTLPDDEAEEKEELSPETPYETRYFMALVDHETLLLKKFNTSQIVALRQAEILDYLNRIYYGHRDRGFIGNYRYARQVTDEGTLIVVVDWSKQMNAANTYLLSSILISLIGTAVVFILVLWLSKMAVKPIEDANARQKRFITDSNHELKTPLAIISANTEVLEMEYGENEWTTSILHQVERLTSLTSRLTQLSRLDETDLVAEAEMLSFTEMVTEATDAFSTLAERSGLAFHVNVEEGLFVRGNHEMLSQALSILLDKLIVLCRYNDSVYTQRLTRSLIVLDSHLTLGIRAKIGHLLAFATDNGQLLQDNVRKNKRCGHILTSLVTSVTKHNTLVTCCLLLLSLAHNTLIDI